MVAPDFLIHDAPAPVLRFINSLVPLWTCADAEGWRLDLSAVGYLGPDAAALIYAAWLRARTSGTCAEIVLPSEPEKLRAFCWFSGLEHYLQHGRRPQPDHPECETVPLHHFHQVSFSHAARVSDLVRRHQESLSADQEFYLQSAVNEVMQNIEDHAESNVGGILCARYMSGTKQVRVAVVDHGIGIGAALRREARPDITDEEGLKSVFRGRLTPQRQISSRIA